MFYFLSLYYDKFMEKTEEACLRQWRQDLLEHISGDVLEIGAGTGANIKFYPEAVTSLFMTEPDKTMRMQLDKNVANSNFDNVTTSGASAEVIDAKSESFDCVISTLVCCSVKNLEHTLAEIFRVLKPGGSLMFLEHVAAEKGTKRRKWQYRINPIWRRMMGNCHLIRETESEILNAGFEIKEIKRESMRKSIPVARPTIRGIAVKPLV